MDVYSILGSGAIISLVSLCAKLANGNNKRLDDYVKRPDCHDAMNNINIRIDDLKDHIDKRVDDVCGKVDIIKDLVFKNTK